MDRNTPPDVEGLPMHRQAALLAVYSTWGPRPKYRRAFWMVSGINILGSAFAGVAYWQDGITRDEWKAAVIIAVCFLAATVVTYGLWWLLHFWPRYWEMRYYRNEFPVMAHVVLLALNLKDRAVRVLGVGGDPEPGDSWEEIAANAHDWWNLMMTEVDSDLRPHHRPGESVSLAAPPLAIPGIDPSDDRLKLIQRLDSQVTLMLRCAEGQANYLKGAEWKRRYPPKHYFREPLRVLGQRFRPQSKAGA